MSFIKNFKELSITPQRNIVLTLIETALGAIEPKNILEEKFVLKDKKLQINEKTYDLVQYNRIFLIGFGKGSAGISKIIEEKLGSALTDGYVIDLVDEAFKKIHYTKGTHPLTSQTNVDFTKEALSNVSNLTEKDLVLVVICGGGSAMFELPHNITLERVINLNKTLLKLGENITEMNTIRKHLSEVKGGGLAKHLYPATIASLIFSDVPGNNLSVIASGPTVKDPTTLNDVKAILEKYNVAKHDQITIEDFVDTPQDDKYFTSVSNILMVSNLTALEAMQKKAEELGHKATIFSDRLEGDAHELGKQLIEKTHLGEILLAGGESTVVVKGKGKGGRNQTLVLSSLPYLRDETVIASFGSDGQDFFHFAGAIADMQTIVKAKEMGLEAEPYLEDDDSYTYWEKIGDGIFTDKLNSNVSDLMIVSKI